MHEQDSEDISAPVFLDRSGRRWRRMRRGLTALGVISTVLLLAFVTTFLVPPVLPDFRPATPGVTPRFVGTRQARLRRVKKEQLYGALQVQKTAQSIKRAALVRLFFPCAG